MQTGFPIAVSHNAMCSVYDCLMAYILSLFNYVSGAYLYCTAVIGITYFSYEITLGVHDCYTPVICCRCGCRAVEGGSPAYNMDGRPECLGGHIFIFTFQLFMIGLTLKLWFPVTRAGNLYASII